MRINSILNTAAAVVIASQSLVFSTPAVAEENNVDSARKNLCWQFQHLPNCDPAQFERLQRSKICDNLDEAYQNMKGDGFYSDTERNANLEALDSHRKALQCRQLRMEINSV